MPSPITIARPGSVCSSATRTPAPRSAAPGGSGGEGRLYVERIVDFALLKHVSLLDREAHIARKVQHHLSPRRSGTRPDHWRHHHADLPDLDLRAGGARQAQGVRVRADAESDTHGARA